MPVANFWTDVSPDSENTEPTMPLGIIGEGIRAWKKFKTGHSGYFSVACSLFLFVGVNDFSLALQLPAWKKSEKSFSLRRN